MNSLWPTTFWVAGREIFFARFFFHAENTTAKSADGHAAPVVGLLWLLVTPLMLLSKLHSKRRHTPGQMFAEALGMLLSTQTCPQNRKLAI